MSNDIPFLVDEKYLESWPMPFIALRAALYVSWPHSVSLPSVDSTLVWRIDILGCVTMFGRHRREYGLTSATI